MFDGRSNSRRSVFDQPKCPFSTTHHDRHDRSEDDNVSAQEGGETRRTGLNLPWTSSPTAKYGCEKGSALDVQVFRSQKSEVIGRSDRVCRDICTESGKAERSGGEERGSTVRPQADDRGRIPVESSVDRLTR